MKGNLIDTTSGTVGSVELPDRFFAIPEKKHLIHMAVRRYLANARRGTADTQERADVSYSTHKMRPQKGSGRSRQGARTANIWKGGAVVFGPHPRDFSIKMNKKEKRTAIFSALSSRFRDGNIHILKGLSALGKTKEIINIFKKVSQANNKELGTTLLLYSEKNGNVEVAARNIPFCKPLNYRFLNSYDLVVYDSILITEEAVKEMEGWWKNE
ncbi:MAG: 50S ribosomal protein L4 [Nitrospiraceae bacterium]|nr:50S ribosomal protein L4 [Nitrospiraceae bacterium]